MPLERFIILEKIDLNDEGETVEFIYSDIFDPDKFKKLVSDPETPEDIRDKCKNRLFQVKDVKPVEYNKLPPKPPS